MRKWLSVIQMLVALALVFAVIGCSSGASPVTEPPETGSEATDEAPVSQETEEVPTSQEAVEETPTPDISDEQTEEPEEPEATVPESASSESKALVIYFSHTGNTQKVAEEIQSKTGGELWELVAEVPYTDDYNECVALARQELADDARPAISGQVPDLSSYDTIYLGFPIWCGDTPMIVRTLLESSDFSGKTIAPFSTSGSSGIGTAQASIAGLSSGATLLDGLSINSSSLNDYERLVGEWLDAME